jgi:hypothetical protein
MDACRNKAFALLIGVFLGGVVSGAVGLRIYSQQVAEARSGPPAIDLDSQPGMVAEHLRQELDLNEAQVAQVEEILDDCIMREADLLMQIKQLKGSARQEILDLLEPNQRQKFDTVIERVGDH